MATTKKQLDCILDRYFHCELCDCEIHFSDTYASDFGAICEDCARANSDLVTADQLNRIERD